MTTERKRNGKFVDNSEDPSSEMARSPLIEEEVLIEPHLTESYEDEEYGTHSDTEEQTKQGPSKTSKDRSSSQSNSVLDKL